MIVAAFWISELVRAYKEKILARFAKVTGLLVLAGVLAVGSNAGMLYYIQTHSKDTIRGGRELKASLRRWREKRGSTWNTLRPGATAKARR